ncbi:hypothetical protein [Streptomyces avermitilis]|uniref:hypothetical protein n=1 Tax=Streptomyces avermitilis TaxID=33903 RepID=UPI0033AD0A23
MEAFFDGLDQAIRDRNWHAALVMALTLPDICAKTVTPTGRSKQRYVAWFNDHVKAKYTNTVGAAREETVFLSGEDCYALRCALLHEGSADITSQPARDVLEHFHFSVPGHRNNVWHCNQVGGALLLAIDHFASDILNAARKWWEDSLTDDERAAAQVNHLTLIDSDTIEGFG